jgi:Undecaprenyl-phosphate glucose phosphotransferase
VLKQHHEIFQRLFLVADMLVITSAWLLAYYLRFYWGPISAPRGIPPLSNYLPMTMFVWLIWAAVIRAFGLYKVSRSTSTFKVVVRLTQAATLAALVTMAIGFLFWEKEYSFSRGVFVYFCIVASVFLAVERVVLRRVFQFFRARGYNLRHLLIIGSGDLARQLARAIRKHPGLGFEIRGFLAESSQDVGRMIEDAEVIGTYDDVQSLLEANGIDQVMIALPLESTPRLEPILTAIGQSAVDIKIVPDIYKFVSLRGGIEEFDGLPVVSLLDSPLGGWNDVLKRIFDLVVATLLLIVLLPLFVVVAIAVKWSSPGPVFFRQERMSLVGHMFLVWKFRTMRKDAERETGPVWTKLEDSRRTRVGTFLRRYNLDELPQLWNVIRGDMSLVGPRPERPVFIREFRQKIPRYMLRHKVRAGMTGWAQVHGLRGDTSLEDRIEHDLYYIENWSLLLDLKILVLTAFRGFSDPRSWGAEANESLCGGKRVCRISRGDVFRREWERRHRGRHR